ncbi:MAG: HU family DNA-binding protein, partial [Ignavibacteriae bacterium]|nr:HU family DNA-binding protein [Ignavibacteriota bacterium]
MNKEKLEQKISELLNVAENDSSFAFNTFKEKIVQNLKVGEAIRINNLGVFQLKEQLREDSSIGRKTLLFSPAKSISDKDSLFLTLEIDPKNIDSIEFDEKVFQLGIDKPMINLDGKDSPKDSDSPNKIIENKITTMIDESERMDNFDIWEDYLEGKESKSILDDSEKDEIDSFLEDDGTVENEKTVYESDFEELNEEEIFNELMDEGNLNSDELDELTSNIEKEGEIKKLIEDENIESKNIDNVFLEDEEISETLETVEDDLEKINEKEVEDFVENNLADIVDEKDFDLEYEGENEILDEVEKPKLEIEEIKDVEKIEESENTNNELVEGAAKVEKK